MNTTLKKSFAGLDASLGRCSRCMRKSFLAALAAWALTLAGAALGVASWAVAAPAIAAVGLTALWLGHVAAFAFRATAAAAEKRAGETPSGSAARDAAPVLLSRRQLAAKFAGTAAFAAIASAISTRAFALCGVNCVVGQIWCNPADRYNYECQLVSGCTIWIFLGTKC